MNSLSILLRGLTAWLAVALGLSLGARDARGVLVAIEYYDQANINPEFAGGPLWTGYVDTAADTLTIETWVELPLHGLDYWVPRQLPGVPLVWRAYTSGVVDNANPNESFYYDVPDTFDGSITDEFAFVSDVDLLGMEWKKPIFTDTNPPVFSHLEDVTYTLDTGDIWPGWGGYAREELVNGVVRKVFRTANPSQLPDQPAYDEHMMPALPVQNGTQTPQPVASTDAIITAEILNPSIPVPETRAWLTIPVAFLIVLAVRWFLQRRRLSAVPVSAQSNSIDA